MSKKCSKCKKTYEITKDECSSKTMIPYQFCSDCREKNRNEMNTKKNKIIEKKKRTNKNFCFRCQNQIFSKKGKYCKDCKIYQKEHIANKREEAKNMNNEGDFKICTKCCNEIEEEYGEKKYKTCENCRNMDKMSYYKKTKVHKTDI